MAKTNIIVPEGVQTDYTSVIVSYSNGIDSTGALYWALKEFDKRKIFLLYCDTGFEYPENIQMFYRTAKFIDVKPVLLQHPKGFLEMLLTERLMWPDMKNRWCTAYLKTGITDKWIRANRNILGTKCLFVSGERRDESRSRAKMPEIEYHSTTLKTKRVADFTCHWYRPCLDFEKGKMFEQGKELHLEPHFCYEYLGRCSCMACMFMSDTHAIENTKRYPDQIKPFIDAEIKIENETLELSIKDNTADYTEVVKLQGTMDRLVIGFNSRLVLETLKAFDNENLSLSFGGGKQPMKVEAGNFKAIVLPIQLREAERK